MTGAEALERLRALRGLCLRQRELLAGGSPDLAAVQALAAEIDGALAGLPAPETLVEVDDPCLDALRAEAQAVADLHRLAAYALSVLRSRTANAVVAQRAADSARAYADAQPEGPRFIDQKQ